MASRSNILYAYPPTSSVHTQGNNLGPLITKAKIFDTMRDDLLFAAQSQTEVQTWEELHEIYPRHMVIDRVVPLRARCVRVCVHAHVRMRGCAGPCSACRESLASRNLLQIAWAQANGCANGCVEPALRSTCIMGFERRGNGGIHAHTHSL